MWAPGSFCSCARPTASGLPLAASPSDEKVTASDRFVLLNERPSKWEGTNQALS
jgi:hypothetical protein